MCSMSPTTKLRIFCCRVCSIIYLHVSITKDLRLVFRLKYITFTYYSLSLKISKFLTFLLNVCLFRFLLLLFFGFFFFKLSHRVHVIKTCQNVDGAGNENRKTQAISIKLEITCILIKKLVLV